MRVPTGGSTYKVGIIGLTMKSDPRPWVKYLPVVESAKAAIAKMRAAGPVDAIIALTHLPMDEDQALVTAVPEIDLSLGGHEHENFLLYRGPNLTPLLALGTFVVGIVVGVLLDEVVTGMSKNTSGSSGAEARAVPPKGVWFQY